MKKPIIIFFVLVSVFWNFSCKTTDPKIRYPDMVADMEPVTAGTIEAEFKTFLGRLNKLEVEVEFRPRYNEVVLNFRTQATTYRQFWNQEGRELFIKALQSYNADYNAQKLEGKFSRTRRVYGKFTGKLEWSHGKFMQVGNSLPLFELGYSFQGTRGKETPYFTVSQNSAIEESTRQNDDSSKLDSIAVFMYFTREQAAALAKLFDQAGLLELIRDKQPQVDNYDGVPTDNEPPKAANYGEAEW
ncbi:hypothetical protein FACS1894110_19770 [Spirochaetia bacterium]|nr:hypothetical protein FACS1894110_19770 [Spirochaetia bacterium]